MDEKLKKVLSPPLGAGLRNEIFSVLLPGVFRSIARLWKAEHGSFGDYVITLTLAALGDEGAHDKVVHFFQTHALELDTDADVILNIASTSQNPAARAWAKEVMNALRMDKDA